MPSVGYLETRQKLVDYELLLESVRGSQIDLGLEKSLGKNLFLQHSLQASLVVLSAPSGALDIFMRCYKI